MKSPEWCKEGTQHNTKHGIVIVKRYIRSDNVIVTFCGFSDEIKTSSKRLRDGSIKNKSIPCVAGVGFIGYGKYKSRINKKKTKQYSAWVKMIQRCYLPSSLLEKPTYLDCTVCDEWHNFQNFAEWYDDNHPKDGKNYDLDKDIKIDGNKEYSPASCKFVTRSENIIKAHAKNYKVLNPEGREVSIYNMSEFCRFENLQQSKMISVCNGKIKQYKGWSKAL